MNGFQDRQHKVWGLASEQLCFICSEPMEVLKSMTVAVDACFELIMSSTIARGREAHFRFHVKKVINPLINAINDVPGINLVLI